MLNRALRAITLRYLLRHPWQVGLAVLGIALGVAVVVAVDLANASAQRALAYSIEQMVGRATHTLTAPPPGIPDDFYARLRIEWADAPSAPRVAGFAVIEERTYELLGIDPFAETPFGRIGEVPLVALNLADFLIRPGAVLLPEEMAAHLGVGVGDRIEGRFAGRRQSLEVAGVLPAPPTENRARHLLVADIATAQELLGSQGYLGSIDLILNDNQAEMLRQRLPAGFTLETTGRQASSVGAMTRGFALNLAALSLLALIVGGFLIYNTTTFSVVQRRELFGLLRALGATRAQVLFLVLREAVAVGLVGTLIGLLAGLLLAQGLVQLVTRTIDDLYFVMTVREFFFDAPTLLKGAALGSGITMVVALIPAWEAGGAAPRAAMMRSLQEQGVRRSVPLLSAVGAALALVGAGVLAVSQSIVISYIGLFTLVLAVALLSPVATLTLVRALPTHRSALLRLAVRGVTGALSRTTTAIAALMVAIAATVGIAIMVTSFRATVLDWLAYHLRADIYISVPEAYSRQASVPLNPELIEAFITHPGVIGYTHWRGLEVTTNRGPMRLSVLKTNAINRQAYRMVHGGQAQVWRRVLAGEVLVSESLAYRERLAVGDTLTITTERGPQAFRIAGIFYDYGSDRGVVLMERRVYELHWSDRVVSALGLYLAPGAETSAVIDSLETLAAKLQAVTIRSNQGLRSASIAIFDRTFTITQVLRLLAMGVAFVAVLSALLAIQLERAREFAVLRAMGMTPGQLWRLMLGQTLLMGTVAGLLALPLGVALGWILTQIINRQSFGWSVDWQLTPEALLISVALALAAALLAALYPAWRMARTTPAAALREE